MQVKILGAGQEIGRSCVVVTIGKKTIMLDCGMHMGYTDYRKFPDFSMLGPSPYTGVIDCVLITHFHMDHCGGLPYFTEVCGYDGPVYMTPPTKAILPIILQDYCKVSRSRETKRERVTYGSEDIEASIKKIKTISIKETIEIEKDFYITAYYAGHVLGAAIFHVQVGDESLVYTGDYNMSPDRHLDGAWVPNLRPSLLITESTYALLVRDCRRERESEFVESVVKCVKRGGKALIPVFALGRAHELCLLLDAHWEKTGLTVPIYTSATLTHKANEIYKQFIEYTHEYIRKSMHKRNLFDFQHVRPFDSNLASAEGPMVLFSSPGMLHSGPSLSVFKKWCGNPNNLIIFPGYCVKGTIGEKVLNKAKKVSLGGITYPVRLQVKNMPFSAHADQRGIFSLIHQCNPQNILLVHGDIQRMRRLANLIEKNTGICTVYPPTGSFVHFPGSTKMSAKISDRMLTDLQEFCSTKEGLLTGTLAEKNGLGSMSLDSCKETVVYIDEE
ncbi:integrator complex subunit 11 [Nematocida sp. LUAm3]|nr:integrator complex subunit 11 [Nematocida sp. LUAm3]KAI5176081.1 integrator complex subunit 11 [Nematocida sp. LUAm2]KAI5177125.1 integrator complex subunit 11 [Nematocida sp. LUAm1]